jgi:hypothetical protein
MPFVIGLVILVGATVLLIWYGWRAWRVKSVLLRWSGVGVSGLLSIAALSLSALAVAEEFVTTMRTGTDPGGHQLREQMPWRAIGKMDDEELGALYEYLNHLETSASVTQTDGTGR